VGSDILNCFSQELLVSGSRNKKAAGVKPAAFSVFTLGAEAAAVI
jgi:hypothetical protein